MKWLLPLLLALSLLFTACQKAPGAQIVVQKNTEQMIEKALESPTPVWSSAVLSAPEETAAPDRSALYDALGIPAVYQTTLANKRGRLTVHIDVAPDVPGADALPVARVVPANFSQELVTAIYDYLIGDTAMFEHPNGYDKVQLEKLILECKQRLADPANEYRASDEKRLKQLEGEYASAPDKHTRVPGDSTLKSENVTFDETDVLNGVRTSLNVASDVYGNGKALSVFNNTAYDNAGSYSYVDEEGNTQMFVPQSGARLCYVRDQDSEPLMHGNSHVAADVTELSRKGGVPAGAKPGITPQEARAAAQDFLGAIGAGDMAIASVSLMSSVYPGWKAWRALGYRNEEAWQAAGSPDPYETERQGYAVLCLRTLNGVTVASDLDATNADGTTSSPAWNNEKLYIAVDEGGISAVTWNAPLAVTEIVTPNATVKPFREIREIIEKMMFVLYEPWAKVYTITHIRLSLQRISEQDSFESGLLAPVWNVYGYETIRVSYDDGATFVWENGPAGIWPLLTINAIDGSVIDIYRGY